MSICSIERFRFGVTNVNAFVLCVFVSLSVLQSTRAQDDAKRADTMLNELKQRSAQERWQRMKRQNPVDTPAPRRSPPAPLAADQKRVSLDSELPPAPAEGFVIPRLAALPVDDSTDWIRPARPVIVDDDSNSADGTPAAVAPSVSISVPDGNLPPLPVERTADSSSAKSYDDTKETTVEKHEQAARSPIERKISSINPFYDRDRDSDIRTFAREKGKEFNIDFKSHAYQGRSFPEVTLAWEPTNFYYYPLYFSDPALERYGHTYPPAIQAAASIARFGTQLVLLPYQMTITPPGKPEYPLGYYRPGEYAPKLHYQIPLNAHAAVTEAAVMTGFFFVIP